MERRFLARERASGKARARDSLSLLLPARDRRFPVLRPLGAVGPCAPPRLPFCAPLCGAPAPVVSAPRSLRSLAVPAAWLPALPTVCFLWRSASGLHALRARRPCIRAVGVGPPRPSREAALHQSRGRAEHLLARSLPPTGYSYHLLTLYQVIRNVTDRMRGCLVLFRHGMTLLRRAIPKTVGLDPVH